MSQSIVDAGMYFLKAPVLGYLVTPGMKNKAMIERMKHLDEIMDKKQASDYETLVMFLSAATIAKLDGTATKFIKHLGHKLGMPECEEKIVLYDYEERQLDDVKSYLFKKQMEAIKKCK